MSSKWTDYETGTAWCESAYKYQTVGVIAEFANALSALPIIIMPLLGVAFMQNYVRYVNPELLIPPLLLAFNGVSSAYYHATLNLFGQLIDEVSLVWLTMSCVYVSVPTMKGISEARKKKIPIRFYIILVTTIITCLCFINPWLNSFVLMFISIPGVFLVHNEAKWAKDDIARFFERKVFALWMLAMACWFSDRVFCGFWLRLGIPYFHAIFHLLSSIAAYFLYLLFVLLDIERRPNHGYEAKVKFFPSITIPIFSYIALTERKNRT